MKRFSAAMFLILLASLITACSGGGGGGGDMGWIFDAGEPVDVAVVLETDNTVEALIPVEGGSITATGADGSVYTLDIPSDALLNETTIGLTPVASIAGMPFGGDQTYAVQLSPDGLFLQNYAILTITPAEELAVDQQIFFDYLDIGKDVILAAPVVDSSEIKINVLHFSGYGATNGTDAGNLGGDAGRRLSSAIAEQLGAERQRQLNCDGCPADTDIVRETAEAFREYEEQVIQPLVEAAGESCEAGKQALQAVLGHERQLQLVGGSDGSGFAAQYAGLYDTVGRACVIETFEECVELHGWFYMWVLYDAMVAENARLHVYSAGTMSEARDLTVKCVTFRLVFESTGTASYQGLANYESSVEAEIILRLNPDKDFIEGQGEYTNTNVTGSMTIDCTVAMTPGGGSLIVIALLPIYGGSAEDGMTDLRLLYFVTPSTEQSTITCPSPPGPPSIISGTAGTWSLAYYDAHFADLESSNWQGLEGWEMEFGHLFATREWDLVGQVDTGISQTEAGSFELYHEPGG
jgi:hypothetical protein